MAKEMIRRFKVKAARAPDAAPPDASDAVPDPPDDAAAPAAAAGRGAGAGDAPREKGQAGRRKIREGLIETHLSLLLCD